MSAERFPVAVDSITIPGRIDAACKKSENFNVHINVICNNIYKFYGMEIVTHAPAQRPTRCSSRRRSIPNAAVHHQIEIVTFSAPARRRIVSAVWKVFLPKQLQVREGKDKVLASWIRDAITHDLGRRASVIDVVAPVYARVLMSAR